MPHAHHHMSPEHERGRPAKPKYSLCDIFSASLTFRDRQAALTEELEVACGNVKHDKAVLLRELRLTLTENAKLAEKCEAFERQNFKSGDVSQTGGSVQGAGQESGSRTSSGGGDSAGASALQDLPSLSLEEPQNISGTSATKVDEKRGEDSVETGAR